MNIRISLRQIEAFKLTMELGSVSKAAEMLCISQPAVSKLISSLEAEADLELFTRIKGRLHPTDSAEILYKKIDEIFSGIDIISDAVVRVKQIQGGTVSLGLLPALVGHQLADIAQTVRMRHPHTKLSVHAKSSHILQKQLLDRKLDICLVKNPIHSHEFMCEPVLTANMVCIMPLDHPLSVNSIIHPHDIDDIDFIDNNPGSNSSHVNHQMFDQYGIRPNIIADATTSAAVTELVVAGFGIAMVHPQSAYHWGGSRIVARAMKADLPVSYYLGYPKEAGNRAQIDTIVEAIKNWERQISHQLAN